MLSKLKQHLRSIKGADYDEIHPEGHQIWDTQASAEFLKIQRRPGDLSIEERERRRVEAQKKHYILNRDKILQKNKDRREQVNNTLQITKDLCTYAQSIQEREKKIRTTTQQNIHVLTTIYGSADKYDLATFVNLPEITHDTFSRFVVYFLDQSSIPTPNFADHSTPIRAQIPSEHHFRQISLKLHPDNETDAEAQKALNSSYDLWRPILQDEKLANVVLPPRDELSIQLFEDRGANYARLLSMYYGYVLALSDVARLLRPESLTVAMLSKMLGKHDINEGEEIDDYIPTADDELIQKALAAPLGPSISKHPRKARDNTHGSDQLERANLCRDTTTPEADDQVSMGGNVINPELKRYTRSQTPTNTKFEA